MRNDNWKAVFLEQRRPRLRGLAGAVRRVARAAAVPPAGYHIPLGPLRDWEQGRAEPDQAARAYLKVIAREPDVVLKAALAWYLIFQDRPRQVAHS
jgi:hypothetical protein